MQQKLFSSFFESSLSQQLSANPFSNPIFDYTDILLSICKKANKLFNNSRPSIQILSSYIVNNLLFFTTERIPNPHSQLLISLNLQQNYIVYFTQIAYRLILLGFLCKIGQQNHKKQWKFGIEQFILEAKMEFMFAYHQSLATMLVGLIDRISEVCSDIGFYEIICRIFQKYQLDFVEKHVRKLIANTKENWITNHNKINLQISSQKTDSSEHKTTEKSKSQKAKKSIKIMDMPEKKDSDQDLKRRISMFRQHQKRRLSENHQSSHKRTIFQSRRHTIKIGNIENYEQQQSYYIEKTQQETKQLPYTTEKIVQIKQESIQMVSITQTKHTKTMVGKAPQKTQQTVTILKTSQNVEVEDSIVIPGTPPKLKPKQSSRI